MHSWYSNRHNSTCHLFFFTRSYPPAISRFSRSDTNTRIDHALAVLEQKTEENTLKALEEQDKAEHDRILEKKIQLRRTIVSEKK